LGVVAHKVTKPSFAAKPIASNLLLPPLPEASVGLLEWLKDYYAAPWGSVVQLFLPHSWPQKGVTSKPYSNSNLKKSVLPALTIEQKKALSAIKHSGTYVLHGETGSGKTRVYTELAEASIKANQSVIVLTPEIGLTSQLERTFRERFGDRVLVFHSQLTEKQRRDIWYHSLTTTQPLVVIGARSALFCPLKNIGLVIVDEAHESSYKQTQTPQYQAVRVASQLAQLHKAQLILGSATPAVTDY
jgi:primosomal protein N' (replication factor Y)